MSNKIDFGLFSDSPVTATPKPLKQVLGRESLGIQMRIWRNSRISDAHQNKLLRLYVGEEFTDLLDEFGRYPVYHFNEIRRRLGYKLLPDLLADIRTSAVFYLVGDSSQQITAIFSPVWHEWEPADGPLLPGSFQPKSSRICGRICDALESNINITNTTVGNAKALTPVGEQTSENKNPDVIMSRDAITRRSLVRTYFRWLERQNSPEQKSFVDNVKYKICHPCDKKGNPLVQFQLTPEEGNEVWDILVEKVFIPYFQTREKFFSKYFMQCQEKRIYWLNPLMKKYGNGFLANAKEIWRRGRRARQAETLQQEVKAMQQFHPNGPHEWEDEQGNRWYNVQQGLPQLIPAGAPVRPSAQAVFNYLKNEWR